MNYRTYIVKQGDTVQNIAQQIAGDITQWQNIVEYNGLKYPYISDEGDRHVATIGDKILVPIREGKDETSILDAPTNWQVKREIQRYALGEDMDITSDRSAIESRGTSDELVGLSAYNGDIATVQSKNNLIQAILLRLNTPKGTLLLHPEYGNNFSDMIGTRLTQANLRKFDVYVTETLAQEPRLKTVEVHSTVAENDSVIFDISVFPIDFEEQLEILTQMDTTGTFTRV